MVCLARHRDDPSIVPGQKQDQHLQEEHQLPKQKSSGYRYGIERSLPEARRLGLVGIGSIRLLAATWSRAKYW